jgi:uncharacterized membrane protein
MRNLHNWYLTTTKQGRIFITTKFPREYYFRTRSMLSFQNCSSYTILTPSTNLSLDAIVYKLLNSLSTYSVFQLLSLLRVIILIISFYTLLLCRMKIQECKIRRIYNVGFIDLDKVNIKTLMQNPEDIKIFKGAKFLWPHIVSLQFRVRVLLYCTHLFLITRC